MHWIQCTRNDPIARRLADRHYNRQHVGASGFVPPGRCVVLRTMAGDAFWVTSWPFAEYTHHAWGGAWVCSAFRNESPLLSSLLIRDALAATRHVFGDPPALGMVTFVNVAKVKRKRDPGRCYVRAGFTRLKATTKGGLVVLQMLPDAMPSSCAPGQIQQRFDWW